MHRRWLCTSTALLCLLAQAAFARNVFVTPNDPSSNQLGAVNGDPFSFGASVSTISGSTAVLPSPNAQKFYVLGSGTSDNLGVLNGRFPNLTAGVRIAVGMAITAANLTPDGRRLLVAGPGGTAIIDTSSDTIVVGAGSVDTGVSPVSVASSIDSRYAYVLSASSGRLTSIDLNTNAVSTTATVPNTSTSVSVGANGVIYVSATNQVYEIDPGTLKVRAVIPTIGTSDVLQFTPNGRLAVGRSLNSFSGSALVVLDLQSHKAVDAPSSSAFWPSLWPATTSATACYRVEPWLRCVSAPMVPSPNRRRRSTTVHSLQPSRTSRLLANCPPAAT